ncbi:MAG: hypothetical protein PVJ34_22255 [Anaerolineae bacterium]
MKSRTSRGDPVVGRETNAGRHSFVVRIWREEGHAGWWGWVQHTRSGDAASFQTLDELLAFVEGRAGRLCSARHRRLK